MSSPGFERLCSLEVGCTAPPNTIWAEGTMQISGSLPSKRSFRTHSKPWSKSTPRWWASVVRSSRKSSSGMRTSNPQWMKYFGMGLPTLPFCPGRIQASSWPYPQTSATSETWRQVASSFVALNL